jgi:hypothetical protein
VWTRANEVSQKEEIRVPENRKSGFLLSRKHISEKQEGRVPKNRSLYIKRIPEETLTLETTTTDSHSNNEETSESTATEWSSCRFIEGESSVGSLRSPTVGSTSESTSLLINQLALEYRLNGKQRQSIREYCDLKGEEYVRSKADVVRSQPRRNAAGALLTALRDDWQPPVNIKGEKNMPSQRVVRPGNRNIGNSNEHCDFSQYRSSQ